MTARTEPLAVGVIGVGGMGAGHCRTIREDVPEMRLAAVADRDAGQAAMVGEQFGSAHFASPEELIESDLCDAVIVAAPHPFHAEIAVAALAAGLHVLSEKPLSDRPSGADAMLAAAEQHQMALGVMFQQRFAGPFAKAIEIARSGRLGRVLRATAIVPDYRTQAYYDAGGWRATWRGEGGGVLLNQSPHALDCFVQIAGLPETVLARVSTNLHDIEVEDCAHALLSFPGGGIGYVYCSTTEPGGEGRMEVFGDLARLTITGGKVTLKQYDPPVSEHTRSATDMWARYAATDVPVEHSSDWPNHKAVMANFARHILSGDELLCSGLSALGQLELASAMILSGHTGREISLPVDREAYDRLLAGLRAKGRDPVREGGDLKVTDPHFAKGGH